MINSYPSTFIYLGVIISSILLIISSSNWFFTWIAFELSLFGFLPLFSTNTSTTEAIINYYLIQTSGSAIFFASFLFNFQTTEFLTSISLMINLGLFPFFQWIPIVIISLSWMACLVLTTLQNLAPLAVLIIINNSPILLYITTLSILISSILGFNQTYIRPLIAYSSISHTSWISLITFFNTNIILLYLFTYFYLTGHLFYSFNNGNTNNIDYTTLSISENITQFSLLIILTGIPPFSVFIINAYILFILANNTTIIILLIISTYLSTFYYLTVILPNLTTLQVNNTPVILIITFSISFTPFFIIYMILNVSLQVTNV